MRLWHSSFHFLAPGFVSLIIGASAMAGVDPIEELGNGSFQLREEAMTQIVDAAVGNQKRVIDQLLAAETHPNPEISRRAAATLERVFLRFEKGFGAPKSGLGIKSKIVMVKAKLGTRPLVDTVEEGSAADLAGLQKGDLIISVDGATFDGEDGAKQLLSHLANQIGGAKLLIRYARKGEVNETSLVLGEGKVMPQELEDRSEFVIWKKRQIQRTGY